MIGALAVSDQMLEVAWFWNVIQKLPLPWTSEGQSAQSQSQGYLEIKKGEKVEFGEICCQLWQIPQLIVAQIKGFQELEVGQTALQAAYAVILQPSSKRCTAICLSDHSQADCRM